MQPFIEKNCSEEWKLFLNFHKSIQNYNTGDYIIQEGSPVSGMHFMDNGKAKVVTSLSDEKERLIRLVADGDMLGHRGLAGNWQYPISCIALTPCKVCFIPIKIFNTLIKSNPTFAYAFSMFMADELRKSEEKSSHLPVVHQVAKIILLNYEVFGMENMNSQTLSYTLSRKDIAAKANITYESVIRALSELKKQEMIKINNKKILIPSIKKLYSFVN